MRILLSVAFLLFGIGYTNTSFDSWVNFLTIIILSSVIVVNFSRVTRDLMKNSNQLLLITIVFIILMVVSYFRSNMLKSGFTYSLTKSLKIILTFGAALSFFMSISQQKLYKSSDKVFFKIIAIPLLFIIINLLFKLSSYDVFGFIKMSPDIGTAKTLYSLTGIELKRVPFPLSGGVNTYGSFLGATLVLSLSFFLTAKNGVLKGYALMISILNLVCLLLLDTRSALLASVLIAIGTVVFKPSIYLNHSRKIVWLIGILPIVLVLTDFLLKNADLFSFISRTESSDVSSGSNRNIIWAFCIQEVSNFKMIHIIGYGEFGQVGSKISNLWADDFSVFDNAIYTSAHNTTLQLFLDIGYFGVIAYYILLIVITNYVFKMFKKFGDRNLVIFQNFVLYISFIGGTEAINAHPPTFYLFIILIACIILYEKRMKIVNQQPDAKLS